jgi:hypothetical protein
MDGQGVRLYNLNPARGGSSVFGIHLNNGGNADEFEDKVVRALYGASGSSELTSTVISATTRSNIKKRRIQPERSRGCVSS